MNSNKWINAGLLVVVGLGVCVSAHASPRRVLVESFVNVGSAASRASMMALRGPLQAPLAAGDVIMVDYHVSWPAADPLFEVAAAGVEKRAAVYGVNYVPTMRINGIQFQDAQEFDSYDAYSRSVVGLAGGFARGETPIDVQVTPSFSGDFCSVAVDVRAERNYEAGSTVSALQPRLYVALLGDEGAGPREFLGFLSGPGGEPLSLSAGGKLSRSLLFSRSEVANRARGVAVAAVAAWVQEPVGMTYNAAIAPIGPTPARSTNGPVLALATGLYRVASGPLSVSFAITKPADVDVSVFDVVGRRVATLESGAMAAGVHQSSWNGKTTAGQGAPAGLYLVRLRAGSDTRSEKLLVLQ